MQGEICAGVGIPELGWRLSFLMAGCLYIGNALKDLVCAPRPVGMKSGDYRPKLIASNAEAATYALVRALAICRASGFRG